MNNEILKLKSSLCDAISKWANDEGANMPGWDEMDTYFGDSLYELMADSAFNVMLAQRDLTIYLREEKIKEP